MKKPAGIKKADFEIKKNVPLAPLTTFGIGGPADFFVEAKTTDELVKIIEYCQENKIPFFILGGGSNILVSDSGFRGMVIKNKSSEIKLVGKNKILVDSGVLNSRLVKFTADKGLAGVEFLIGIPGTVGGAVRHNARFRSPKSFYKYFTDFNLVKDCFIGDLVESVTLLTGDKKIKKVDKNYCQFDYGNSGLRSKFTRPRPDEVGKKRKDIILKVLLKLERGNEKTIQGTVQKLLQWRLTRSTENGKRQAPDPISGSLTTQPKGKSAGCVFSNTSNKDNHPAGRLIDMAGLKGKKIGGAQISPLHANFIINLKNAKAKDVLALIKLAKKEIKKKFNVTLKEEIDLVGF